MPRSINFDLADAPLSVDGLGASAESLLYAAPDLALLRVRQLLEVFVAHVRNAGPPIEVGTDEPLGTAISSLLPCHLRSISNGELRSIARACNAAVHHNTIRPRESGAFARDAREQLAAVHGIWAKWLGVQRQFRLPDAGSKVAAALADMHVALDRIERRADVWRDPAALADLDRLPPLPKGITAHEQDLIDLRRASIRRAADNHAGKPPEPALQLWETLLRSGDGQAQEESLNYLNRVAVGHLNDLACDEALQAVAEFVEWRQASATFLPKRVADLGVSDRTLGALLGTQAQAMAMDAFAKRSVEQSDQALATFQAARACFIEPEDLDRQDTYRAHALIDRVRLGGALSEPERRWLTERVQMAPVAARTPSDPGGAFRVALALKAHFLLGIPYAADRVAASLLGNLGGLLTPDGHLPHPYENIAGWLLRTQACPNQIRRALEQTAQLAEGPNGTILGWIAKVFLDYAANRPAAVAPGRIARWSLRVAGQAELRALDALPFNYA